MSLEWHIKVLCVCVCVFLLRTTWFSSFIRIDYHRKFNRQRMYTTFYNQKPMLMYTLSLF